MEKFNVKTLFFDYDGTLHNTMRLYKPAFMAAYEYLKSVGLEKERTFEDHQISQYLGYTAQEMWDLYDPNLDPKIKAEASTIISNVMIEGMMKGKAALFDGAKETLKTLKDKGYQLVFLSNCKINYMEAHSKLFGLDQLFDAMICAEQHQFVTKSEILAKVLNDFPSPAAVIGDRHHDMTAANDHGLVAIGCAYGYGKEEELNQATTIIHDIKELLDIL